jgi:6-pyruvoyltetrahydropterin/6-carboxytetrahydropterin synthase
MATIRLTKEFHFEMAHVLDGYDGPCRNVHGHSFKLEVTVIGTPNTDSNNPRLGMVMDFGELKNIVTRKVVDLFDHVLLVNSSSELAQKGKSLLLENIVNVDYQPTCENLLLHISKLIASELPTNVKLHHLKLHETASSYAEWYASDNE